jgi:hypothetical protein
VDTSGQVFASSPSQAVLLGMVGDVGDDGDVARPSTRFWPATIFLLVFLPVRLERRESPAVQLKKGKLAGPESIRSPGEHPHRPHHLQLSPLTAEDSRWNS